MCCIIFKKKCTYTTLIHIENNTISLVMNNNNLYQTKHFVISDSKGNREMNANSNFVYMYLLVKLTSLNEGLTHRLEVPARLAP